VAAHASAHACGDVVLPGKTSKVWFLTSPAAPKGLGVSFPLARGKHKRKETLTGSVADGFVATKENATAGTPDAASGAGEEDEMEKGE
jgi:hypothetical protein